MPIKPTIGRVVWFYPDDGFSKTNTPASNGDALPALITRVWSDTMINIGGFDANGQPFARTSVTLLAEDGQKPAGMYACWIPYQRAQAATQTATPGVQTPAPGMPVPALAPGERYAGIVIDPDNGQPTHHLVLLPEQPAARLTWDEAIAWAASIGAELPTRQEATLLYANLKPAFEPEWHWTGEQYAGHASGAWIQVFDDGRQLGYDEGYKGRVRAVRRFLID